MTTPSTSKLPDIGKMLSIGAVDFDSGQIVEQIRKGVAANMEAGVYADLAIARAERVNLANLGGEEDFFAFYMDCLRDTCFVDINDFEIVERRARLGRLLVAMKKAIWKLLKFYTYRLWVQQNQINGLFLSTIQLTETRYRERIEQLEERIAALERRRS